MFTFIPIDVSVDSPDSVTLTCVAVSKPPGMYTWQRVMVDGGVDIVVDLVLNRRITLMEGNLTFSPTERNDAGMYRCIYQSELGYISSDATLTIRGEKHGSLTM